MNMIKKESHGGNRNSSFLSIPDPNPNYAISLKRFKRLDVLHECAKAPDSFETRKLILHLLKDPTLWKNVRKCDPDEWCQLGMDLYRRTGEVVGVKQLVDTFRKARRSLGDKVRKCAKDGLSLVDTENVLSQWDLFNHIRFYYEFKLENRNFDDENDEEIEFLGYSETNQRDSRLENDDLIPKEGARYQDYPSSPVQNHHSYITPFDSVSRTSAVGEPKRRKRHLDISIENDVEQISYQLNRIFIKYPEKENLIRKALFATILEFDDTNFNDLGTLFTGLATKHSPIEQKFQI
uniref:MADF domain-containing protein n=1 Tax=Caenorhabditis tropicalis TaxID=1561998 RepID=A0A1I7TTB1_9PELO